ncbi:MAG: hypothetical protein Dasosvirus1_26 [Dasosvirus sp.]|uniref:Uncharacterized protein n=1 Tax=Dasosvirus sp. TaxID=2487764 RepID=A0A3G4ZTQ8_9VIRU|nr:MAG: hypothetical protein Dasosvirus1_26 [Dasosvirus sp.]
MDFKKYYEENIIRIKNDAKQYYDKLIKHNTDIKNKAFWLACAFENISFIKNMIKLGKIDCSIVDFDKNTGFMLACEANPNLDVIKYLRSLSTNIKNKNKNNLDALHLASQTNQNVNVIKYLIDELGFDPTELDNSGRNIFFDACIQQNLDIIQYLRHILDIRLTDKFRRNALHIASKDNKNMNVIKYLIDECGFDPEETDINGNNCFLVACAHNTNPEIIQYYSEKYHLEDSVNIAGYNGLSRACTYNTNPAVIETLIKKIKQPINFVINGFWSAIEDRNQPVIDYLISSNYFVLFGELNKRHLSKISISQEQQEIMDLIYYKNQIDNKQKNRIVQFFIDNHLTGRCFNSDLIKKIGYQRVLKLAINGLLLGSITISNPDVKSPFADKIPESFTRKTDETKCIFTINSTKYYAHRDLVILGSSTYANINSMVSDKENISWDLKYVDSDIVGVYLESFYTGEYKNVNNLNTEQIIGLCQLVHRIPSKFLTVQKLEQFLVTTFNKKYLEYYEQYVRCNELYLLLDKVYL